MNEFLTQVLKITGRPARASEIAVFNVQVETAIAHRQPRIVQMGFCDFQTVSGRAELIKVAF